MTLYVRHFQNQEQELLDSIANAGTAPHRLVQRARLVLRSAAGETAPMIAKALHLSAGRVREWIRRFNQHGVLGLFDRPRPGRPREITEAQALRVVEVATSVPTELGVPVNTWSLSHLRRYLAEQESIFICRETIRTILDEHGISYQKVQTWQKSDDPDFPAIKEQIESYYLDPPPNTLVLCFDQKGPVQFRKRRGSAYRPRTHPHRVPDEYERRGTGYLLAALDPHSGRVWGRCFRQYNSLTVIWFLGWLLPQLPQDRQIVIIWDNASPHSKMVKGWLRTHYGERIQWVHTPTKAAWLNLIEAWISIFERDLLHNSDFADLDHFSQATRSYLDYYNDQARPFRWGRKRKKRIFLVGPLKQLILRGRAGAAALTPRLARPLAKLLMTF